MKKFNHGFIVGKFMPLHNGHVFLIDTALAQCEQVTVLLLSQADEPISGTTRLQWLQTLYPNCTVVHFSDQLPRDETGYDHWDGWLLAIRQCCPAAYDAVFSSEAYGARLADDFNAAHVLVDQSRELVPISGTEIRQDPTTHFKFLPAIVQTYYENQN